MLAEQIGSNRLMSQQVSLYPEVLPGPWRHECTLVSPVLLGAGALTAKAAPAINNKLLLSHSRLSSGSGEFNALALPGELSVVRTGQPGPGLGCLCVRGSAGPRIAQADQAREQHLGSSSLPHYRGPL